MHGCFTGQPPGTNCFYTSQSPDVRPSSTGLGGDRAGVGEALAEGWEISGQVVVSGKVFKQETGSEGRARPGWYPLLAGFPPTWITRWRLPRCDGRRPETRCGC